MEQSAGDRTVLVTGGTGFLGGWCIVELLAKGHRVRTSVRSASREPGLRALVQSRGQDPARLSVVEADLSSDDGWADAAAGCDFVLHVASPFPSQQPSDPNELIVPAREGTLRVLRAGLEAGARRVVITSSVAAVRNSREDPGPGPLTEANWTDADNTALTPYTRSKTYAELAAWELAREHEALDRLAVVNPAAIIGPVLHDDHSYSLQAIERLLGGMPGTPRLGFTFVDVRDVALLQIAAMSSPVAGGQRYLAVNGFLWMSEVAKVLRDGLGADGTKVPTRTIPNFVVRAMALADPSLRSIVGDLGRRVDYSNEKARSELGWAPRPIEDTILECARSLLAERVAA
jgi:dihydroflavonol-4-reductase